MSNRNLTVYWDENLMDFVITKRKKHKESYSRNHQGKYWDSHRQTQKRLKKISDENGDSWWSTAGKSTSDNGKDYYERWYVSKKDYRTMCNKKTRRELKQAVRKDEDLAAYGSKSKKYKGHSADMYDWYL